MWKFFVMNLYLFSAHLVGMFCVPGTVQGTVDSKMIEKELKELTAGKHTHHQLVIQHGSK